MNQLSFRFQFLKSVVSLVRSKYIKPIHNHISRLKQTSTKKMNPQNEQEREEETNKQSLETSVQPEGVVVAKDTKDTKRKRRRKTNVIDDRSTDGEDDGEDLRDFIVEDDEEDEDDNEDQSPTRRRRTTKPAQNPNEVEINEDDDAEPDETTEEGAKKLVQLLVHEAEELFQKEPIKGSETIGGRTLRARHTIRQTKDEYWERFGREEMERLMLVERKKERLQELRAWVKQGFWTMSKQLTVRSSDADIDEEHTKAKAALGFSSSDDENDEQDESEHEHDNEEDDEDDEKDKDTEDNEDKENDNDTEDEDEDDEDDEYEEDEDEDD